MPTTLGVGEALVRASKGNAALALLLLVGTNSLGEGSCALLHWPCYWRRTLNLGSRRCAAGAAHVQAV